MEYPDEVLDDFYEERQWRRYRAHLAQHPHPSDPDHPTLEEYGLEDDDE